MATRSTIAVEYTDGHIEQIYCHWDGYPSHNGMLLLKHWATHARAEQLMRLGDLSSLGEEIGDQHDFDMKPERDNWCTAYGRDRSETGCECRVFSDFAVYDSGGNFEEYNYMLRADGHWYLIDPDGEHLLAEVLADELHRQKMDEEVDN